MMKMDSYWSRRTLGEKVLIILLIPVILLFLAEIIFLSLAKTKTEKVNVSLIYGRSGMGKTYHAALIMHLDSERFICNANIIANKWLITTAHCASYMKETKPSWSNYLSVWYIKAGTFTWNGRGLIQPIIKYIIHPRYDEKNLENNIALIKVQNSFDESEVDILKLSTFEGNEIMKNKVLRSFVYAGGWGKLGYDSFFYKSDLKGAIIKILDKKKCIEQWNEVNKISNMEECIIVTMQNNDTCLPGEGSALIFKNRLIGINSWGESCGYTELPQIYIKLFPFKDWIIAKMKEN